MRLQFLQTSQTQTQFGVFIQTSDDLWELYNLIFVGDSVQSTTDRKIARQVASGHDDGPVGGGGANGPFAKYRNRKAVSKRRRLILEIVVTTEPHYDARAGILRLRGSVASEHDGIRIGSSHTLEISTDITSAIRITKVEWTPLLAKRLREACARVPSSVHTLAILLQASGYAQLFAISASQCITLSTLDVRIAKKRKGTSQARDDSLGRFFSRILQTLLGSFAPLFQSVGSVVVASPSHLADEWTRFATDALSHKRHHIIENLSRGTGGNYSPKGSPTASPEPQSASDSWVRWSPSERVQLFKSKVRVLKVTHPSREALLRALSESHTTADSHESSNTRSDGQTQRSAEQIHWHQFQSVMRTSPDKCTYGLLTVLAAVQVGAVDLLLLAHTLLRDSSVLLRRVFNGLVEDVELMGGRVQLVSEQSGLGVSEQLSALGGIAALLRYELPGLDEQFEWDDEGALEEREEIREYARSKTE